RVGDDGTKPDPLNDDWKNTAGAAALLGKPVGTDGPLNRGIYELERIAPNVFNLLCIPAAANLSPNASKTVLAAAAALCEDRRAFLLVDIPEDIETIPEMVGWVNGDTKPQTNYAAVYFPRLQIPDPLRGNELKSVG